MNISNLAQHLLILKPTSEQTQNPYIFKMPYQPNKFEIIELIVNSNFDKFTALFKSEIQSLAQNLQKKKDTFKNEGCKLLING